MKTIILISNISQALPFIAAYYLIKLNRADDEILRIVRFIGMFSFFAFIDISLAAAGIPHVWLFKIYTPLEFSFLFYIIFSYKNEDLAKVLSVYFLLASGLFELIAGGSDDSMISMLEYAVISITSVYNLYRLLRAYETYYFHSHRFYFIIGALLYCGINLVTYPAISHGWEIAAAMFSLSNILANIFYTLTIGVWIWKSQQLEQLSLYH